MNRDARPGRIPDAPNMPGVSRRMFFVGAGVAGMTGLAGSLQRATASESVAAPPSRIPAFRASLSDFGAVGDGRTDDALVIQAALDWAGKRPGTALHVPPRIFGLGVPLLIPEDIELAGEVPGSGNRPLCGFRALPGFRCDLAQKYMSRGAMQSMDVAALLVAKEWSLNADFAGRLHIRDVFFDVDGKTDRRGAPIHGLLLSNQQLDLHNVWVRHPTGYGVWINTQRPDGNFVRPIVDNVLRRVWVRGAGIGDATYTTDDGVHRFGGFLIGALPGARDGAGRGEPPIATDGVLDYCTVAVGPEKGLGCRGDGILITHAAGWRLSGCHINGAGRHGIRLRKAYQTEISGTYLDGWGVDAREGEGDFGGIWCTSMVSLEAEAEGSLLVCSNRVRARPVRSLAGNRFAAIGLSAGIMATPHGLVANNVITRRRDVAHSLAAFNFGRSGRGNLEVLVVGNVVSGTSQLFLRDWDEAAVRPWFNGNSFQHAKAPPETGWHPTGLRIDNTAPVPGGWGGWLTTAAGEPGTWRGIGMIEA